MLERDLIVAVWCENDERPAAEVVDGRSLCSLCLWKLRSPSWRGARQPD
jgi:hypothetical protein